MCWCASSRFVGVGAATSLMTNSSPGRSASEHLVEGECVVADVGHRLDRIDGVEGLVVELRALLKSPVWNLAREIRFAPGLFDLRAVQVDAVRAPGQLGDVFGDGPAAAPNSSTFSRAGVEIFGDDPLEEDLISQHGFVGSICGGMCIFSTEPRCTAGGSYSSVSSLLLPCGYPRSATTVVVVGAGVLRGVDERSP